ncbi:MAG: DUF499 domain-containing protein [Candidatus Hodarchaeales archaeon]|jgi:hypothetical protein
MKPWYKIIEPLASIRFGQIEETEFTSDLTQIVEGKASQYYQDPQKFFKLTYMTRGLQRLLQAVQNKVTLGKGNSVIKIQTPFGGGKTHALIAVYHFITNGKELLPILPVGLTPINTKIVTIEGTHLNPLEGYTHKDISIKTLWGEIAYQLGGKDGYKQLEENDRKMISPGKGKLIAFFSRYQSFLILLDEIAEYITKAEGISVNDSNLGVQTFLFLQELSEVLSSLSNALMIITLPVHQYEFFSEKTEVSIKRINQILGRVESTETPIERDEISKLIIKRLIEKCVLPEDRESILSTYVKLYQSKRDELPAYSTNPNFIINMRASYPFHPDLIDILYDKWSKIPSFQGTRAILRILSKVLNQLWVSKTDIDLICLGNIDLASNKLRNEFLQHINQEFNSVLESEVCGSSSKSKILDSKNVAWKNLASEISSTIFLSSVPVDGKSYGLTLAELKLFLIKPDEPTSVITEVIDKMEQDYWYLHFMNGRYFFSGKPNLNHTIQGIKESYRDSYEIKMKEIIKSCLGNKFKSYLWPNSSTDIPDDQQLKFIIAHPSTSKEILDEWVEIKGSSFRQYKNTLFFTLPNRNALNNLIELTKTLLALLEITKKISAKNVDRDHHESLEISERIKKIERILSYNVRKTYSVLYDCKSKITLELPDTTDDSLTNWYYEEMVSKEILVIKLHFRKITDLFLSNSPFMSTKKIIEQFYIDPKQLKIISSKIIKESICNGVKEGEFGIASLGKMGIKTISFHFLSEISSQEITFSNKEIILKNDIAKEIKKLLKNNEKMQEIAIPEKNYKSYSQEKDGKISLIPLPQQKIKSLMWEVTDLDSKFLPLFYKGIIKPLQSQNTKITLELKMKVESDEINPNYTRETSISETLDQLGVKMNRILKD